MDGGPWKLGQPGPLQGAHEPTVAHLTGTNLCRMKVEVKEAQAVEGLGRELLLGFRSLLAEAVGRHIPSALSILEMGCASSLPLRKKERDRKILRTVRVGPRASSKTLYPKQASKQASKSLVDRSTPKASALQHMSQVGHNV